MKTRVETMSRDVLVDGEFQCIYCARFMREEKAVVKVHEKGYWVHSCIACDLILSVARVSTLEGRQRRVSAVLNIGGVIPATDGGEWRPYVSREGVEQLKRAHNVLTKGK